MPAMEKAILTLSWVLILGSFLPSLRLTHWSVRNFDFIRVQTIFLQIALILLFVFFIDKHTPFNATTLSILVIALIYQCYIIFPFIPKSGKTKYTGKAPSSISVLSINVYQDNTAYNRTIDLIKAHNPDILLTLETNQAWDNALQEVESSYSKKLKIPRENTYGMHLYTNLEVDFIKAHYFVSDERPAIEAHLRDSQNNRFIFWGIHPPPPSPTEMETSKQKDAELMIVAKEVLKSELPTLVIGDFNNVCWSRSARLFSKVSKLKDARKDSGLYSTFPVKPALLRFPLDLLYYSEGIKIDALNTLPDVGSDHLPFFSWFHISSEETKQPKEVTDELEETTDTIIKEGMEEVTEDKGI